MDQGNAAVIAGVIGAIAGVFGGVTIMLIQKNYEQKKWNRGVDGTFLRKRTLA